MPKTYLKFYTRTYFSVYILGEWNSISFALDIKYANQLIFFDQSGIWLHLATPSLYTWHFRIRRKKVGITNIIHFIFIWIDTRGEFKSPSRLPLIHSPRAIYIYISLLSHAYFNRLANNLPFFKATLNVFIRKCVYIKFYTFVFSLFLFSLRLFMCLSFALSFLKSLLDTGPQQWSRIQPMVQCSGSVTIIITKTTTAAAEAAAAAAIAKKHFLHAFSRTKVYAMVQVLSMKKWKRKKSQKKK